MNEFSDKFIKYGDHVIIFSADSPCKVMAARSLLEEKVFLL